jgi:hypothetical protein
MDASVESDQKKLEEKARNNLTLLSEIEQAFFSLAQRTVRDQQSSR